MVPISLVVVLLPAAAFSLDTLSGMFLNTPKELNAQSVELSRLCQTNKPCSELPASCLDCTFPPGCSYGEKVVVVCKPSINTTCTGETEVVRTTECRSCFLVHSSNHICEPVFNCSVYAAPPNDMIPTLCHVNDETICLGRRAFYKKVRCNWTSGYKQWKAITLSILAGGFGADRFYLGLWRSGLGSKGVECSKRGTEQVVPNEQTLQRTSRQLINTTCTGETEVVRTTECRSCFLVHSSNHICEPVFNCSVYAAPPNDMIPTLCHVNDETICLGRRAFYKKVRCNWTS
ncbi:TM2 domain containing protein, partial [Trichuris trichiura]